MSGPSNTQPVTDLRLVAYLNDELRRFQKSKPQRCGCRVKSISPQTDGSGWQAELIGNNCPSDCPTIVQTMIRDLQRQFELASTAAS